MEYWRYIILRHYTTYYYIQWDDQGYSDELELEIEFELYFTNLNCKCYPNLYELEL